MISFDAELPESEPFPAKIQNRSAGVPQSGTEFVQYRCFRRPKFRRFPNPAPLDPECFPCFQMKRFGWDLKHSPALFEDFPFHADLLSGSSVIPQFKIDIQTSFPCDFALDEDMICPDRRFCEKLRRRFQPRITAGWKMTDRCRHLFKFR